MAASYVLSPRSTSGALHRAEPTNEVRALAESSKPFPSLDDDDEAPGAAEEGEEEVPGDSDCGAAVCAVEEAEEEGELFLSSFEALRVGSVAELNRRVQVLLISTNFAVPKSASFALQFSSTRMLRLLTSRWMSGG